MQNYTITEKIGTDSVKIVVVGVGGGGSNMVENLLGTDIANKVKLVSINTDAQALKNSKLSHKLQIGNNITNGKGAGMNPSVGNAAALENYADIRKMLLKF